MRLIMTLKTIRQRSEYTFKYNKNIGRHGWLRLTPAYSVKLVDEILNNYSEKPRVLDPFSGTGTTPLCSAWKGYNAIGYELNPFLVWLSNVKVRKYSLNTINEGFEYLDIILNHIALNKDDLVSPPPIHNIERWWSKERLEFLCRLMWCIEKFFTTNSDTKELFLVAFCRVMIDLSNASFNHQSMSFRDVNFHAEHPELFQLEYDYGKRFKKEVYNVFKSVEVNPEGDAEIIMGDSRKLSELKNRAFDLIITSPPYPNRMSYIRELRPYMYWLKYINEAREAGELDWQAIGGTWGIATSRLNQWKPIDDIYRSSYLNKVVDEIIKGEFNNGELLSRYLLKYFEDMWLHLSNIYNLVRENGKVHYIIGNSIFYGVLVPVEKIYREILGEIGFHEINIKTIRKRNSKKDLYEYDISAKR